MAIALACPEHVELHPKDVGRTAATMLWAGITDKHLAPAPVFLEPELILRESSNRARNTRKKNYNTHRRHRAPGTQRIEIAQKAG